MKFKSINNFFWILKNKRSIKNWKKRNFSAPSPEIVKHHVLINNNLDNSLWIETGTYYGDTTKLLSKISKKTISIEADEKLYNLVKKKLGHLTNVEIVFGKSEDILDEIIKSNLEYNNICIYLDAHLCQDHLRNIKTFGSEDKATPIKFELNCISKYINNFKNIVVLIDDIRLFKNNFQNYPDKNYIVDWCKKNNFLWDIEQDIFICKKND